MAMPKSKYATPFPVLHAASLLDHRSRIHKFDEALKQLVTPNSYVIDLGTGSGVLSFLAARAGARKVTAVDISPECIDYARKAASMNGLEDRVEFFVGHFSDFRPTERADLVVCEMLSSMMLIEQQVPACSHALKHLLKKGGRLIPESAEVWIVPVESPAAWGRFELPELHFPRVPQTVGLDDFKDLAAARHLVSFDFGSHRSPQTVDRELSFDISEQGTLHGLVGFFKAKLLDDIALHMEDGWRDIFLPIETPTKVVSGEGVTVRVRYTPGRVDSILWELKV
ncbi:MAG: hypothetical protein C4K47_08230 [Candidatus Thorarchaeota archaeon]|nr:MAG: hypothetical protein C4K47_08230 [Candidatus Thorarchaeota archaeon]